MERTPAMIKRLILALFTALLIWSSSFIGLPTASALDIPVTSGDEEEGDVQEDDCANLDESLAGALGCDTGDTVTDFTEYTGSLEEPDASGYDEALTENTNARDFIESIVNFALSFLGLITVVIMIYGGILYVTSRGDEGQTEKAKKAITYAVIGIIIILGSYAFTNTILQAGGGGGSGSGDGTSTGGETITDAGAAFDVDDVLDEIESITVDYVEAYDTLIDIQTEVASMQALEMPVIYDVTEADYSLGGLIQWGVDEVTGGDETHEDTYTVLNETEVDTYLTELSRSTQDIMAIADPLSDSYEAAANLYNYLKYNSTNGFVGEEDTESSACFFDYAMSFEGTSDWALSGGLGVSTIDVTESAIDPNICNYITDISNASIGDWEEQIDLFVERLAELSELFDSEEKGFTQGSSLTTISTAITTASNKILASKGTISNSTIRDIKSALNDLYELVKNVEFVDVVLKASVIEGNAPLLVRFDILGTEDPSGVTVEDDQIQWDFDGNGVFDDPSIGEDLGADSISYIYEEAGTYRVKVRVLSSDPDIAAGISTVSIEVSPAKSMIVVTATTGSNEPYTIADFRTSPAIDLDTFKVTATEALEGNGIVFDASATTDGEGNSTGITNFEWDFGDNETLSGNAEVASKATHFYADQGDYDVSLTVTDKNGVKDSKYFKLYVASPAARISTSPSSGLAGTTFTLDGSASSADGSQIKSYQWAITDEAGTAVTLDKSTGSSIKTSLSEPGVYDVTLSISDTAGKKDTATAFLVVESQAPVVTYKYEIPNNNQPSVVTFDARDSYDPDPNDVLTYTWDFGGFEGEDYEILEQSDDLSQMTVQYLETGEYTVVLTGLDQHEGVLQKGDTATATIAIDSVLDVNLTLDGETARHLDANGEVAVEFTVETEMGTAVQIDYGDGETAFSDNMASGKTIFSHTYKQAGIFYPEVTVFDDEDNENTDSARVYIGAGDAPIAVIEVGSDGVDIGSGPTFYGSVKTKFTFSANSSINVDGSNKNLTYSWNFGDGTVASQATVTHTFDEKTTYNVALTVKDKSDSSISDTVSVSIKIEGIEPEIRSISVVPDTTSDFTTPLKVDVTVDAQDEDGKISYIKAWYYDLDDTAEALGTVISESGSFTLTINTNGEEGDVKEYGFAVEVTDNDNQTVGSYDQLSEDQIPTLEVTNGPNDNPVAGFSVDKVNVYVGEEVNFSSTSYDPDGEITSYWWDIEGDGFFNNEPVEEASYSYTFSQVHTEGIKVKLKVEDNAGATDESESVTIYVDSIADDPVAKFLTAVNGTSVAFTNNSTIDTENGAEFQGIYWDFDLDVDSDGDGVTDNDFDSFDENPTYKYAEFGTYSVSMTVVDSVGQSDFVTQDVEVKETIAPTAGFTYTVTEKSVTFKNTTEVDTEHDVDVRSYSWDFDLDTDSSGDTDPENDEDSTLKNPTNEYETYGSFQVKLTVVDTYGKTDSVTQTIDIDDPIQTLTALLTSVPQANSLDQIILDNDGDEVSFYFDAEGGSESYSFALDKNIFYDTNGDGVRDNDEDYTSRNAGSWKTPFYESYGQVVTKLTVTDRETGDTDIATLQVVFEGSLGGANLFNATPSQMALLIASAMLTAIMGVSMVFRYKPLPRR